MTGNNEGTVLEVITSEKSKLRMERRNRKIGSVLNLARRRVRNRSILYNERSIFVLVSRTLCEINASRGNGADTVKESNTNTFWLPTERTFQI